MSSYVLDASVVAKWFFSEKHTDKARWLLREANALHAPDFLLIEVHNVTCKRVRRKEITAEAAESIHQALSRIRIRLHPFQPLLTQAFNISDTTGGSFYDSLYLATALVTDAPLVTADLRFYRAISASSFAERITWIDDISRHQP